VVGRGSVPACEDPADQLIIHAFWLAALAGTQCRPVHLAMALAETDGAVGGVLRPIRVQPSMDSGRGGGAGSSYLFGQLQQAASEFAASRGEPRLVAHLAVSMLDQGDQEMYRLLADAGIDAATVRRAALVALGARPDLAVIRMPPLTLAGTLDRPALDLDQLDPRIWRVLTWRQQHLPLSRVRRATHLAALESLEQRAAWRIADEAGVDDDQRYSLLDHHRRVVEQRLAPVQAQFGHPQLSGTDMSSWIHARRRRRVPNFMVGWPTWFANRRVGMRDRWFRLTSAHAYRGQPGLDD
jgi:Clp amino terminal domain, pathogenicity island component